MSAILRTLAKAVENDFGHFTIATPASSALVPSPLRFYPIKLYAGVGCGVRASAMV